MGSVIEIPNLRNKLSLNGPSGITGLIRSVNRLEQNHYSILQADFRGT